MTADGPVQGRDGRLPTRRAWLAGMAGLGMGLVPRVAAARADDPPPSTSEAAALRRAQEAKLTGIGTSRTEHYLAVGDAPAAFREEALALCERLAETYRAYVAERMLPVAFPRERMTVVSLAGRDSYAAFKGEEIADAEAGHYDIDADRLVIFDARGPGAVPGPASQRRINTLTLVHEAIHQLTFDTGLVSRAADVPVALSEGLATFGELWTRDQPRIGQLNRPRLQVLRTHDWIGVEELLEDDTLFEQEDRAQSAYAVAWLLVYTLLRTRTAKFKAYLDLVRTRKDATHRAADAATAFGDLARLDRDLKKQARNAL